MESIMEKTWGHKKVAVALSSGIDSLAIALALKDLGKEVVAYSFHIDGVDSQDWKYAKHNAYIFNIPLVECIIPKHLQIADFYILISKYGLKKKTDIECVYPFY